LTHVACRQGAFPAAKGVPIGLLLAFTLSATASAAPGGFSGLFVEDGAQGAPGARISGLAPDSPAEAAGLAPGDRIVACDGEPTPTAHALGRRLALAYPGQTLSLRVRRDGWSFVLPLVPGSWGAHNRASGVEARPPKPGNVILLAGRALPIDAPVVTWKTPGGFDGYFERCRFSDQETPKRPVAGCEGPRRYATRRKLPEPLAQVVAARGWTPELAALQIDQVVVHYDVAWTSSNCFKVLHDLRGLSCHFLLDVDGTLYQTLDLLERARHGGAANDRSIGIEIAHPGALELTPDLAKRYTQTPAGTVFDLGRLAKTVRTPDFVVRPARPAPIAGKIQNRDYTQYDFTSAQYKTLTTLLATLNRHLPRIRLEAPRAPDGAVRNAALSSDELAAFSGVLGHYHVTSRKQDPGPAFDWDGVLSGARALNAAPESRPR
jgi:N-acetylmuramoyl-L-alanine amidase